MLVSEKDLSALGDCFSPEEIEWRVGATFDRGEESFGIALPYLTARAVQDRLDAVVGIAGWRNEFSKAPEGGVLCGISIRVNDEWITKWDGADNTAVEATKGGLSDAFKRAAVQWGIGRYLYKFPNTWCRLEKRGRTQVLAERPGIPEWAYPSDYKGPKEGLKVSLVEPSNEKKGAAQHNEAPKPKTESAPAEKKATDVDIANKLHAAKAYTVPAGIPLAGKTLGEAMSDPTFGMPILKFLACEQKNKKGEPFVPSNEEETRVSNAAKYILKHDAPKTVAA